MSELRREYTFTLLEDCVSVADFGTVGHTKVRCKAPSAEDAGAGDGGTGGFGNAGDEFGTSAAAEGGNGWETAEVGGVGMQSPPIAAGGGDPW